MLGSLAPYVVGLLGFVVMIFTMMRGSRKQGEATASLDAQKRMDAATVAESKKTVEETVDAKQIRDRLDSDPAYAQRVRDRFTRKDDAGKTD